MLGAFFVIAGIVLFVVHLLASLWSHTIAWILTAGTVLLLVQIAMLVHGLMTLPTFIDEHGLHIRHGRAGCLSVPFNNICSSEDVALRAEEIGPQVIRATILAHPNVAVRLNKPMQHRKKQVNVSTMRLDDPAAFHAALAMGSGNLNPAFNQSS